MEIYEIDKKTANYNDNPFNYQIAQHHDGGAMLKELTVTITLAEYRELVSNVAVSKAELDKEQRRRMDAESNLKARDAEVKALREALQARTAAETEC